MVGNLCHLVGPDSKPTLPHQVISLSLLLSKVACSFKYWLKSYLYLGKGAWWKELRWQGLRVRDSLTVLGGDEWGLESKPLSTSMSECVCVCVCVCVRAQSLSRVWLFATLCTVSLQSPLSMEFSRQKYWEWVAISSSRGSSWPRAWTWVSCVSCIGRQILYPCATWETHLHVRLSHYSTLPPHTDRTEDFPSWKTPLL